MTDFSKHNIFSKISGSDNYFIVNLLTGNADILTAPEGQQVQQLRGMFCRQKRRNASTGRNTLILLMPATRMRFSCFLYPIIAAISLAPIAIRTNIPIRARL